MNQQLFEDARKENIEPTIPNLQIPETSEWTPLHIACMFGKVDFARNFLQINPEFLKLENPDGYSALHLASSYGHLQIVELLRRFRNPSDDQPVNIRELCLKKDKGGRNPLHHAVIKNHAHVVRELLVACPESALDLSTQEETVFHLAVKNIASPSIEVLQALLDGPYAQHLLNLADKNGNTVLHLAVVRKQVEIIQQVLFPAVQRRFILKVNAANSSRLTPLDVLVVDPMCPEDNEIEEMIIRAGGIRLNESSEQSETLKNKTSGLFIMASIGVASSCQIAIYLQGAYWSLSPLDPVANVTSISNNSTTALEKLWNSTLFHQDDMKTKYDNYLYLLMMDGLVLLFSLCLLVGLLFPTTVKRTSLKWVILHFIAHITLLFFVMLFTFLAIFRVNWGAMESIYFMTLLLFTSVIPFIMVSDFVKQFPLPNI